MKVCIGNTLHVLLQMVNLKASAVELLEAMLEETDKGSKALAKEIYLTVHIDALHNTLSLFHTMMNDPSVQKKGYDDEAERGLFRTYHILVHLADYPKTCPLEELGNVLQTTCTITCLHYIQACE